MKKNLIAVVFAAIAAMSVSNTFAASGIVRFQGEILDVACEVDVNSKDQTVILGKHDKAEFTGVGAKTAAQKFNITLKNCPSNVASAKVRFDGTPDTTDSNLLAIDSTAPGAATGVAINLMTADKADLGLHSNGTYSYLLNTGTNNVLDFYAQYKSTASTVNAGAANAVANFSVIYN